jgi:hypothetical protein
MMTYAAIGKTQLFCACPALIALLACGQETTPAPIKPGPEPAVNPITDLMLIYDGGEGRLPWTADRFKPYVYRGQNGSLEWLYDGFLFLDRLAASGRRLSPITNRKDATKADWQDLMGHYFQDGASISALDQLLESLAAQGHKPIRKRMVVIALPTPICETAKEGGYRVCFQARDEIVLSWREIALRCGCRGWWEGLANRGLRQSLFLPRSRVFGVVR